MAGIQALDRHHPKHAVAGWWIRNSIDGTCNRATQIWDAGILIGNLIVLPNIYPTDTLLKRSLLTINAGSQRHFYMIF